MPTVITALNSRFIKPVISLYADNSHYNTIIDTGAHISVFFGSETEFISFFTTATDSGFVTSISGFGGSGKQYCKVMKIPYVEIRDMISNKSFKIFNFLIAICDMNEPYDILLAATTLNKVDYTFHNSSTPKSFEIEYSRDVYCIHELAYFDDNGLVQVMEYNGKQVIKSTKTFLQSDSENVVEPLSIFQ